MPPAVLFVHHVFPGQFRKLATALVARGVSCAAIGHTNAPGLEGVQMVRYAYPRSTTEGIHPLAAGAEADFLRASMAYSCAKRLKAAGFQPQVIVGHTSWGETVFMKELFPDAKLVAFPEYIPHGRGFHLGFDTEFQAHTEQEILTATAKAAVPVLALTQADAIVCPTQFQASTVPAAFHSRLRLIHEGVDVANIKPLPPLRLTTPTGRVIEQGSSVITHVNQQLEPLRGLHVFARALPRLLAEVPDANVLIIGGETTEAYSGKAPDGLTWKEVCLKGVDLDPDRVHFMGHVQHHVLWATLQMSTAHVYYSYPFVLSWSLLEAMALECYLVASDTAPLREVIQDGVNGRLVPFFDVDRLSQVLIDACRDPAASAPLRAAARRTVETRYDSVEGTRAWLALLQEMGLELPQPANA